ncbi:hypothetical protein [Cellulomonas bogoriensis]|uniref:hypothetical protein n=1 Tax=Cellulomonas bogoriensis TaxID=301388 RepID=UPI0012EB8E61|nr:hypothetical protein [Cellulomonas bogoriensis]
MKPWQRKRAVVLNTVILTIGAAGVGWQVFRHLTTGDPYIWPALLINALMVLMAGALLVLVLRMPTK